MSSDGEALTGLWFDGQRHFGTTLSAETKALNDLPVFVQTYRWLDIYFSEQIPDFTPALNPHGSPFRKRVWEKLLSIPYGNTLTYGEIASIIARETGIKRMSAQAVGGAVGHNPVSIIVPCHRVLGANGSLTGYAAGIDKKMRLLQLEGVDLKKITDISKIKVQ